MHHYEEALKERDFSLQRGLRFRVYSLIHSFLGSRGTKKTRRNLGSGMMVYAFGLRSRVGKTETREAEATLRHQGKVHLRLYRLRLCYARTSYENTHQTARPATTCCRGQQQPLTLSHSHALTLSHSHTLSLSPTPRSDTCSVPLDFVSP